MQRFWEVSGGPAAVECSPVLAGVEAPRKARPLRAAALTPAARRTSKAITAGPLAKDTAIPLAIQNWMVSSLDVLTTREDGWDRSAIVRGFWDWRTIG
jgi:hypothetical protein